MFARVSRLYRSVFRRSADEVEPWIKGLSDDGRTLGPAHRATGRAHLPPETTVAIPVEHVGASEDWSPKQDIGGQELSPELRSDADVVREFHQESTEVLRRLSVDMDDLVAAAMARLDQVIEDALANIEAAHV